MSGWMRRALLSNLSLKIFSLLLALLLYVLVRPSPPPPGGGSAGGGPAKVARDHARAPVVDAARLTPATDAGPAGPTSAPTAD